MIDFLAFYVVYDERGSQRPYDVANLRPSSERQRFSGYYVGPQAVRSFREQTRLEDLALQIANAAPAISHIYLYIDDVSPGYWAISRGDEGVFLNRFDHEEGFRKMERMRGKNI